MVEKTKIRKEEIVTREYTINLHKRLHGVRWELNKHICSKGIRSVPRRVRVRIAHKRNDDEDAKEELYTLITVAEIPVEGLKGLRTKVVEEAEDFFFFFSDYLYFTR
ncbi:hypothetical protein MKX01_010205 [Papaver californicum]|nr:hypothetical protein MKX01_010205 [Papaver californicum]